MRTRKVFTKEKERERERKSVVDRVRGKEIEKRKGVGGHARHRSGLHAYKGWRRDALIAISRVDSKPAASGVAQPNFIA